MPIEIPKLPIPERPEWQVLDSTKLQAYCACPRMYFLEYVLGWRSEHPSNHLVFGQSWHTALEHLYKHNFSPDAIAPAFEAFLSEYRAEFPQTTDEWFKGKNPVNAMKSLVEYAKNYASDAYQIKVLDTEVGGVVGIGQDREIAVKLDLIGLRDGKLIALEHKTGSAYSEWWERQWELSIQIGAYLHALRACYDYGDYPPSIVVNGAFFYAKNPTRFVRKVCQRSNAQMLVWLDTVYALMDGIVMDFNLLGKYDGKGILQAFPQHPTACGSYGGCQFHDICSCCADPLAIHLSGHIPSGFHEYWWNPLANIQKELPQ